MESFDYDEYLNQYTDTYEIDAELARLKEVMNKIDVIDNFLNFCKGYNEARIIQKKIFELYKLKTSEAYEEINQLNKKLGIYKNMDWDIFISEIIKYNEMFILNKDDFNIIIGFEERCIENYCLKYQLELKNRTYEYGNIDVISKKVNLLLKKQKEILEELLK